MQRFLRRSIRFPSTGEGEMNFIKGSIFQHGAPIQIVVEVNALAAFKSRVVFAIAEDLHEHLHVAFNGALSAIDSVPLNLLNRLILLGHPKALIGSALHRIGAIYWRRISFFQWGRLRDDAVGGFLFFGLCDTILLGTFGSLADSGQCFRFCARKMSGCATHGAFVIAIRFMRNSRSEEHTSELQSPDHLVCRLLLEKKKYRISIVALYGRRWVRRLPELRGGLRSQP